MLGLGPEVNGKIRLARTVLYAIFIFWITTGRTTWVDFNSGNVQECVSILYFFNIPYDHPQSPLGDQLLVNGTNSISESRDWKLSYRDSFFNFLSSGHHEGNRTHYNMSRFNRWFPLMEDSSLKSELKQEYLTILTSEGTLEAQRYLDQKLDPLINELKESQKHR